ncbi:MAG: nucleotidyl transferase AbiEii/AbiGii toxin family protein [Acidobacteria bacterium]|nr:nucleotidyl transferase AbiEii/AbiGii toxin family protein [Acidobacteriota bacterium]MCY3931494.1 nucleotidyl transferase AbiEii/AbiGii toxin family protein [Acidobacteriota bacterium]
MAERYLELTFDDRREVLDVAASASGRPAYLLEKDIWIVWSLETLFAGPLGAPLVFKGGTSLSKAFGAIRRFSEDVDLSYDIRALAPELVRDRPDALPPNRSQEKRWTKAVRRALSAWLHEVAAPALARALQVVEPGGKVGVEGGDVVIRYAALQEGTGYGRPEVKLEFGGRATGEPNTVMGVCCDAADHVPGVEFPTAKPRVLQAERTFWEKATAAHVYCVQRRLRGDGFARHWHDLVRLDDVGVVARALADRRIAEGVAAHKAAFFREKDATGNSVDYGAAVGGGLRLVPAGGALLALADDYARMVEGGWLLDEAEPFGVLMDACRTIEDRANGRAGT